MKNIMGKSILSACFPKEPSNFVDIGYKLDPRTHRIIAVGAIDNLVKGAAGQAVQNMNLMFGLPEQTGLSLVPMFP